MIYFVIWHILQVMFWEKAFKTMAVNTCTCINTNMKMIIIFPIQRGYTD